MDASSQRSTIAAISAVAATALGLNALWALDPPSAAGTAGEATEQSRSITFADLAPRADKRRGAMELWGYHLFFEDGLEVSLQLSEANLKPVFGRVAGVELSILGFGDRDHRLTRGFDASELEFAPETPELRIQPDIWIRGELSGRHRVRCAVEKNGVHYDLDLELSEISRGPARNDNRFSLERQKEIVVDVPIAFSRVSGVIVIDGQQKEVEGIAVMDHILLSTWPARLLSQAYYVFDLGERWRVGYFLQTSPRFGGRILGYALEAGPDGSATRLLPDTLEVLESELVEGVEMPIQVEIVTARDRALSLEIGGPRQAFSLLGQVRGPLRWLAELYIGGDPWVFRGAGEFDGSTSLYYSMMIVD